MSPPMGWREATSRPSGALPPSWAAWPTWPPTSPAPGPWPSGSSASARPVGLFRRRAGPGLAARGAGAHSGRGASSRPSSGQRPSTVALEFGDVWKLLDERLDDKVGRADFFRGGITVTSLTPLRWVPFRVVCLLGMDQAAFGVEGSAGDDLSALAPLIGDRDPRGEARETAAGGGAGRPGPSGGGARGSRRPDQPGRASGGAHHRAVRVPARLGGGRGTATVVARRLEVDHPRQPYDDRCFEPGRLIAGTPWGFDSDELAGALARREPSRPEAAVPGRARSTRWRPTSSNSRPCTGSSRIRLRRSSVPASRPVCPDPRTTHPPRCPWTSRA